MKKELFILIKLIIIFFSRDSFAASAEPPTPTNKKLTALYNSLDPTSIAQHLAFYELYSQTPIGQQALKEAWQQLIERSNGSLQLNPDDVLLFPSIVNTLVSLVNKPINQEMKLPDKNGAAMLSKLSQQLPHSSLKGHHVWSEQDVLELPLEEIDIARALFLSQFENDPSRVQFYESLIDLIALQIIARLPKTPSPKEKITAINKFIFEEMGFRFPPHSLYAKDIDLYTFLPSVLDSRRGVCLGVSVLYLCIAQRLNLSLEMITPPGHIYVRYADEKEVINIETTARGIHIDSKEYLSINTKSLQKRTIKEVVGMTHFNQASVYWQNGEFTKALHAYQKAEPYMKEDPLLKELMGYILILTENQEQGIALIKEVKDHLPEYAIIKNTMAEDFLSGKIDAEGIAILFTTVDENRQSILAKKEKLEETLKKFPNFRAGILSLAVTWLQLHRNHEAIECLKRFEMVETSDPEMHYYLAALSLERRDYPTAWSHLHQAEAIVQKHQYSPTILKELRRQLSSCCPE